MSKLQAMPLILSPYFVWMLVPIGFYLLWRGVINIRSFPSESSRTERILWAIMAVGEFAAGAGATWLGVTRT